MKDLHVEGHWNPHLQIHALVWDTSLATPTRCATKTVLPTVLPTLPLSVSHSTATFYTPKRPSPYTYELWWRWTHREQPMRDEVIPPAILDRISRKPQHQLQGTHIENTPCILRAEIGCSCIHNIYGTQNNLRCWENDLQGQTPTSLMRSAA